MPTQHLLDCPAARVHRPDKISTIQLGGRERDGAAILDRSVDQATRYFWCSVHTLALPVRHPAVGITARVDGCVAKVVLASSAHGKI
jgi:hypothetical protein